MDNWELNIGSNIVTGWETFHITYGLNTFISGMNISFYRVFKDNDNVSLGQEVILKNNGNIIFKGKIVSINSITDINCYKEIIEVRSYSYNLVKSDLIPPNSQINNVSLKSIISKLCNTYNVPFEFTATDKTFDTFTSNYGEKINVVIDKLCRKANISYMPTYQGGVKFFNLKPKSAGVLKFHNNKGMKDNNIISAKIQKSILNTYDNYYIDGQKTPFSKDDIDNAYTDIVCITDNIAKDNSSCVIFSEDVNDLQNILKEQKALNLKQSFKFEYILNTNKDANNKLFECGDIVEIEDTINNFTGELLISSVKFEIGNNNRCELNLSPLNALDINSL